MKITIIGAAGTLGSCAAFNIAVQGLVDEIVMIDPEQNKLRQHVSDLGTAVTGQDIVVRAGSDEDMSGSDLVMVTAGVPQRDVSSRLEFLADNLSIIEDIASKIKQLCAEAVVITATAPVEPLNYALYLCSSLDRRKLLGYTLNDSFRFRMWVAQALGVNSSQVDGTVIGEHGDSQVMLFSSLRVNGKPVSLREDIKQKIRSLPLNIMRSTQAHVVGRTSGWTSAVGLTAMVHAIARNTGEMIPCSVVLDGEYGCHQLCMGVPAILGRGGAQQIQEWKLPPDEQEGLKNTISVLETAMRYVEENLSTGRD